MSAFVRGILFAAATTLLAPATLLAQEEIERVPDDKVSAAVETEFITQRGVPPAVDIQVNEGVVSLYGSVDSILERQRAEDIAMRVKGVRGVVNSIVVEPEVRTDAAIAADVEEALAIGPVADSWQVAAIVEDGVVTLKGTANSWQERRFSELRAKSVEGVRDVVNKVEIEYADDRPDAEIAAEVKERLAWDVRVDDAMIDVSVDDATVRLDGTVGSLYERERAVADAWVTGVGDVDSNLDIAWWARDKMKRASMYGKDDADVAAAVRDTFLYDPRVEHGEPTIIVDDGSVTLTGTVETNLEKHAAEEDARNVVGVWRVNNLLRVVPEKGRRDAEIAGDIQAALISNPFTESFEVDFAVANGVVTLRGDVDSKLEKSEAARVARTIPGVTSVYNVLEVDPNIGFLATSDLDAATMPADRELKANISDQLFWSPFVDENDVRIAIDDGVATLRGEVDTWLERSKATENAFEGGAVAVVNKLDVVYGGDVMGM